MVGVQMREQDAVHGSVQARPWTDSDQGANPIAQHGVRDHAVAVDLDQHRGVAEPGDREAGLVRRLSRRCSW